MSDSYHIRVNAAGGIYETGRAFSKMKWYEIVLKYERILKKKGRCTVRMLAAGAKISLKSANKAMIYHDIGMVIPPLLQQGHCRRGVGSMCGMHMMHHMYIYKLYLDNPALPVHGYMEEMYKKFGLILREDIIHRWFMTIGPFKGTMRLTSKFPSGRDSWATYKLFKQYLQFIVEVEDHRRIVFADEKPMKEIDIYGAVRRYIFKGDVPKHQMEANAKNRYNILAAVNIKGRGVSPLEYVVLEECSNAALFIQFVLVLMDKGILVRGDILVVDNCSIHCKGDNVGLQESLFRDHGILMITLPPYHPDYNPTEFVFRALLKRLRSERARYNSLNADDFLDAICLEMGDFNINDTLSFYDQCGYNR